MIRRVSRQFDYFSTNYLIKCSTFYGMFLCEYSLVSFFHILFLILFFFSVFLFQWGQKYDIIRYSCSLYRSINIKIVADRFCSCTHQNVICNSSSLRNEIMLNETITHQKEKSNKKNVKLAEKKLLKITQNKHLNIERIWILLTFIWWNFRIAFILFFFSIFELSKKEKIALIFIALSISSHRNIGSIDAFVCYVWVV